MPTLISSVPTPPFLGKNQFLMTTVEKLALSNFLNLVTLIYTKSVSVIGPPFTDKIFPSAFLSIAMAAAMAVDG